MHQKIEIKVVMDNMPVGSIPNAVAAEIQAMLHKEYADGVLVNVSVTDAETLRMPQAGDVLEKEAANENPASTAAALEPVEE